MTFHLQFIKIYEKKDNFKIVSTEKNSLFIFHLRRLVILSDKKLDKVKYAFTFFLS